MPCALRPPLALGLLALACSVLASGPAFAAPRRVIPPGQEALLLRMLGAGDGGDAGLAGCQLYDASILDDRVALSFECARDGRVGIELRHQADVPAGTPTVESFGVSSANAPPALVAAVIARLRDHHGEPWRWMSLDAPPPSRREPTEPVFPSHAERMARRWSSFVAASLDEIVVAACACVLAVWTARRRSRAGPSQARGESPLVAVLVAAVAFAFVLVVAPAAPAQSDTLRDLALAEDCARGYVCGRGGPVASFRGLVQGALWVHLLSACRLLGIGMVGLQRLVGLGIALSTAVVYRAARPHVAVRYAAAGAAAYLLLCLAGVSFPLLWNPSALPLPLALHAAFFLAALATGGVAEAALAAAALGFAIDSHIVCVLLVAPFLIAIPTCAARPKVTLGVASLALAAATLAGSTDAWRANFAQAAALRPSTTTLLASGAVVMVALALAHVARSRGRPLEPLRRARIAFAAALGLAVVEVALLRAVSGRELSLRYVVPAAPAVALGVAWILSRLEALVASAAVALRAREPSPGERTAIAAVIGAVFFVTLGSSAVAMVRTQGRWDWTLREIEELAPRLLDGERGASYAALSAHLRDPSGLLLTGLSVFEPDPPPERSLADDVIVLRFPRGMLPAATPPSWEVVKLDSGAAAVIRRVSPFLRRDRATVCYRARRADGDSLCASVSPRFGSAFQEGRLIGRFPSDLYELGLRFPAARLGERGRFEMSFTWEVVPRAGPAHVVSILPSAMGWNLAGGRTVRASAGEGSSDLVVPAEGEPGTLTISRGVPPGEPDHDCYRQPVVLETEVGDELLREAASRRAAAAR